MPGPLSLPASAGRFSPVLARLIAIASLFGAAAGVAGPAFGQGSDVFGIDPSKQKLTGRPTVSLEPTTVFNRTERTFDVEMFVAPLYQAQDGSFDIDDSLVLRRAAGLVLQVSKQKFQLKPGQQMSVGARWIGLPRGAQSAALGLVARAVPSNPAPNEVNSILRVIGIEFLRLPGASALSRGRLVAVSAEQGGKRTLQFAVSVKNTGPVWDIARDRSFVIRDAGGKVRYRGTYASDLILPGVTRDFPITVQKVLPAGAYTAIAQGKVGASPVTSAKTSFRLVGPNELPTSKLDGNNLRGEGEIGSQAKLRLTVSNTGTRPTPVVVRFTLKPDRGVGGSGGTGEVTIDSLGVGKSQDVSTELGRLAKGRYFVTAVVTDGRTEFDRLDANFSAAPTRSFWDRFGTAVLAVLGLLLAMLLLLMLLRRRRAQRRERAELEARLSAAEARAAAERVPEPPSAARAGPAESASPGTGGDMVHINTADAATLQQLPGVGPRAAARIVEHREEYGAFSSIDGLLEVEGFDAQRVAGLRAHVRL